MKKIFFTFLVFILLVTPSFAEVKKADLAGSWYPASEKTLKTQLNSYLEQSIPPKINGQVIALIAPHAGYLYSGSVAAYGFNAIKGLNLKTVIVVGFSHKRYFDGIAVLDEDGLETPFGIAKIDKNITREFINQNKKIFNYPVAFKDENSVEMEIPFVQMTAKNANIVLIAIGVPSFENIKILGEALHEVLKDKDNFLLIASTDMSHYLPYEAANKLDKRTIGLIEEFDSEKLFKESSAGDTGLMCGYAAVCATAIASKMLGADKIETLKYANSGDTAGDKSYVVGYLSAAIIKSEKKQKEGDSDMLSDEQKKKLLKIARDSMETYVKTGNKLKITDTDPVLNREMGAFVTLHKNGQLRGCIGSIIGRGPLYLTVNNMAVESSTSDPRFSPVSVSELADIDLEISVLSELEKIDDPSVIEIGKHGVLIKSGFNSGVFLPQVATETGWSKEEFMNNLCSHKAGLPSDAWKKGQCEIYIFSAVVFSEK